MGISFLARSSCSFASQRSLLRLCTKLHLTPILFKYNASTAAEFPPPTMRTFRLTKKLPSQTAQYDIPRPLNSSIPLASNVLTVVPVANIIFLASIVSSSASILKVESSDGMILSTSVNSRISEYFFAC